MTEFEVGTKVEIQYLNSDSQSGIITAGVLDSERSSKSFDAVSDENMVCK